MNSSADLVVNTLHFAKKWRWGYIVIVAGKLLMIEGGLITTETGQEIRELFYGAEDGHKPSMCNYTM